MGCESRVNHPTGLIDKFYFKFLSTLNSSRHNMITDKEKLWYGTILTTTAALSIYMLVIIDKYIPSIDNNVFESRESLVDLQEQVTKQNALLELLQKDIKPVRDYTVEKIKEETEIRAVKSICQGFRGVNDAEIQRQQGRLTEAAATLVSTKEPFWHAGDVLTAEQTPLRALMSPIDALMREWHKGNKGAESNDLLTDVKAILKKVDPIAEYCTLSANNAEKVGKESAPGIEKNIAAVEGLCNGYQRLVEAEALVKEGNQNAATEKLEDAKEAFWQTSDKFPAEQKSLRDLMSPLDVLIAEWKGGNKEAEANTIKSSVGAIMKKAGSKPEACPTIKKEEKPKPLVQSPAPAKEPPLVQAPAPAKEPPLAAQITEPAQVVIAHTPAQPLPQVIAPAPAPVVYAASQSQYQPPAYVPANFGPPSGGYLPQTNTVCTAKETAPPAPQAEPCTFTSYKADYTPKGALHCLRLSLEKIIVAETKHREGDLPTAAKILKATKQTLWRSGDNLKTEQPALGALMLPIDAIASQWEKGDEKAETTLVTAKLTEIIQRLDKASS